MNAVKYEVEIAPAKPQDFDNFVDFLDQIGDVLYADERISTIDMSTEGAGRIHILLGVSDDSESLSSDEMFNIAETALDDAFAQQGAKIHSSENSTVKSRQKTLVMN